MITWLLLLSLFRESTQDGQEDGVLRCGPQNVTLDYDSFLLKWEDDPSCSVIRDGLVYELQLLIADKPEHNGEVVVAPAQIGSTHSWKWTSHLPSQCARHSVRLRSQYNNQSSPWMQKTLPDQGEILVLPRDQILEVGSTATFCCMVPDGESIKTMFLLKYKGTNVTTTKISEHVHSLIVHLDQQSENWRDVQCETTKGDINGASFHAGYPPSDSSLQCETQDLESIDCFWNITRKIEDVEEVRRKYLLQESPCDIGPMHQLGKCSQKVELDAAERNWTLTVTNPLGKLELQDRVDLTKRVHMVAPDKVAASTVNPRNISLKWSWTVKKYSNLNITCQVDASDGNSNTKVYQTESIGVGLTAAVIKDLIPHWDYDVRVRCGTAQHFWKWGDWSKSVKIRTKGDVPDALDVWMKVKEDQTVISWKVPLANQSHGEIFDYKVSWAKTKDKNQSNQTNVSRSNHSLTLTLDPSEEYMVTVTARNINGSSSPSTIIIPRCNLDTSKVKTSWISGSNGSFFLSWPDSPNASCGYIVDWCPVFGNCSFEWMKVPPNRTHTTIFSKNFEDGRRYLLSIYACTEGAAVLLQRREGYIRETKIGGELFKLKYKQEDSAVEVSWEPIPLEKQTASIHGYILYYQDQSGNVFNVSTDDPEATSLTAKNLNISMYTFTVTASTAFGLCGNSSINVTLNPLADQLIMLILISLGAVFLVLSVSTIICYRHWACIKHKVYPPIPKPVLTEKWLASPDEHTVRHLPFDQSHYSEVLDVPELRDKFRPPQPVVGQDYMPFTFSQTPKGYYNKPLKKLQPCLTLPTTGLTSQPGLPSFPINDVFPNPSYNLIVQGEDQESQSHPEIQEGMPIIDSECQPQSPEETFTTTELEEEPDSPISCVSTYILLPQKTSK
ncbi:leukemia inhibitory factor receptor-like isoform X1 [Simochromis diagramma]|uniref:leukemia inhibitory factor receptor-like isoform X1 n=1 Tax=Simochromis diagramma TaxID=43689 RepID=UPI001A7EF7FB|nr:leukemia inhibitory factor receptor-like isoform X1 [Simochromis diagramma]